MSLAIARCGVDRARRFYPRRSHRGFPKLAAALPALLLCSTWAGSASADRARWLASTAQEKDGAWSLSVEIRLNRAPVVAYVPVRFTFEAKTYFESALVDGRDTPIVRKIPVASMRSAPFDRSIVQDMEVSFGDPATGKVHKRSRLNLSLARDSGFVAGEYEVDIVDSRNGRSFSSPVVLRLRGQNEVLDRRSMDFSAPKSEPKKEEEVPKAAAEAALTPEDDAFWQGGQAASAEPRAALPPPAHLAERPGGCGCRVAARAVPLGVAGWVGGVGLAAWAARRRLSRGGGRR